MEILDYVHVVDFPSKESLLQALKRNKSVVKEKREIPVFSLKLFDDVRYIGLDFNGCVQMPLEITDASSDGKKFYSFIRNDSYCKDLTITKDGWRKKLLISKNRAPWLRKGMPVEIRYADSGMVFLSLRN